MPSSQITAHLSSSQQEPTLNDLLLLIFQVNGQDVSKSSHDEAVETFLQAQEPITVEVRANQAGQKHDLRR